MLAKFLLPLTGSEPCSEVDPELFFLDDGASSLKMLPFLRQLCHGCPIVDECAEHALKHEEFGFWGGMTVSERIKTRRRLGISLESPTRYNLRVMSARERERKEREQDDLRRLPSRSDIKRAVASKKGS